VAAGLDVGQSIFFLSGSDLVRGSLVVAADGITVLEVKDIEKYFANEIMELEAGDFKMKVTPSHRVLAPSQGTTDVSPVEIRAEKLQVGDHVLCSGGSVKKLTQVAKLPVQVEVLAITFYPDEAVAVFLPPTEPILTKGHFPVRIRRPTRRSGMNKRGWGKHDFHKTEGDYVD